MLYVQSCLSFHEQLNSQRKPLHKGVFTFIGQKVIVAILQLLQAVFSRIIQSAHQIGMMLIQIFRQLRGVLGVNVAVVLRAQIAIPLVNLDYCLVEAVYLQSVSMGKKRQLNYRKMHRKC